MALTPEEIAEKEFAFGLRGYDQEEVRAFLHLVAAEVASGAFGVGSPGSSATSGGDTATTPVAGGGSVDTEAAQVLERAPADAADAPRPAEADAATIRSKAQAVLAAAEAAALRLVAEAHARIDQRFGPGASAGDSADDAAAAGSPTIDALGAEISALVNAREDILLQLQVVRSRVLAAVEAAEAEPVVRSLSTTS